jgi:6-phosphofructokinase 2
MHFSGTRAEHGKHLMSVRVATLTVSPAVDLAAHAASVQPGHKVRTFGERYDPGGGGIDVARVITELRGEALALFASGGVTGWFVEEMLTAEKVPWQAVRIQGACRISVTVRDQSTGLEYRFVPRGPELTPQDCTNILEALAGIEADWLAASGSLPPGVPSDFYGKAVGIAAARGTKFALDTSGVALRASLRRGIHMLKPSLSEFEAIVGKKVPDLPSQIDQARRLVSSGAAEMVALTLGANGAILATTDRVIHRSAISVSERTGVGAGDSFLAGLIFGLAEGRTHEDAVQLALACGAAAVRGIGTARVRREEVEALLT